MTTELAGIAMYMIGAMTTTGYPIAAVVLTGVVTLLLHWKAPMHALTHRIAPEEFHAIARFVLVTLVVLPKWVDLRSQRSHSSPSCSSNMGCVRRPR